MKIIITSASQVGFTLAANLVEDHEITIIDTDEAKLEILKDKYDLRVIQGHASSPDILETAGAKDTDMIIAITDDDEDNIIACHNCHLMFQTKKKIARINSEKYLQFKKLLFDKNTGYAIDRIISPEILVISYIQQIIEHPGSLQIMDFAGGKISLIAVKAYYGGPLVGNALSSIREHMPHIDTRVAAIFRGNKSIMPRGTTMIEAEDEVFFISDSRYIKEVISEVQDDNYRYKNIMIAGGGNIGCGVAKALEKNYSIKLIEINKKRAKYVSQQLESTTVFHGDISDNELLREENIEQVDVFIAITNDDEANIMSSLIAKKLGAKKTMTLIQKEVYMDLAKETQIDVPISPQQATISDILTQIRKGEICNVYSLRQGAAEAIEIVAYGDSKTSKVVGKRIDSIKLPTGASIGAILRDETVLIAHDKTVIETGDHVILFLIDKNYINDIEKLFSVRKSFLRSE